MLQAVRPNAGIEAWYRRQLDAKIRQMQDSLVYWLTANYRKTEFAQDAPADGSQNPAIIMRDAMHKQTRRWQRVFDKLADTWASSLADRVLQQSDGTLAAGVKGEGFTVQFTMTKPMRDAYQAVIGENVALIKSIASQHLSDVEGLVMRSVSRGRDLGTLTKELQARYGVTKRRAALIARDQNNKATSVMTAARQRDLGITEGIWKHSHAGKVPRPSHLKADGTTFDLAKGLYLDSKWVMPGEEINCLTGESQVEFSAGCKKLWRRRYAGELTVLVTDSGKTLEATPNHPILTRRGWVPIRRVNLGEDVFGVSDEIGFGGEGHVNDGDASISNVFDLAALYIGSYATEVSELEFHGDVVDKEIEAVDTAGFLPDDFSPEIAESICKSFFPWADVFLAEAGFGVDGAQAATLNRLFRAPQSVIRGLCAVLALLRGHSGHADHVCGRLSAYLDTCKRQATTDDVAANTESGSESEFAFSLFVPSNDLLIGQLVSLVSSASIRWWGNPSSAEMLGKVVGINSDGSCGFSESGAISHHAFRVIDKRFRSFSGHVFNLETSANWYSVRGLVYHNCRCTWQPVIPGFDA